MLLVQHVTQMRLASDAVCPSLPLLICDVSVLHAFCNIANLDRQDAAVHCCRSVSSLELRRHAALMLCYVKDA